MNILAMETSTKHFGLAVMRDGKIVCKREVVLKKVISDSIIPAVAKVLLQAKVPVASLDGFAVGLGPGSFTSLRVGLATVKALAFAIRKPVVGIASLDAIALNVADQPCDEICVIADARRNLVYSALYEMKKGDLRRKSDHMLSDIGKVLDQVKGRTLFVGDGILLSRKEIESRYAQAAQERPTGCQPLFANEEFWFPRAAVVARLAVPRFAKKKFDNIDKLVPLYLYPEDCQVHR